MVLEPPSTNRRCPSAPNGRLSNENHADGYTTWIRSRQLLRVAPSPATMADDFVVIPPSEDFESARRSVENDGRQLRAIGFFRSQREGALSLGPRELLTFERWFYENGSVALLIRAPRRGDSEAALFYWEGGQPHPHEFGFGFPFDAAKLAGSSRSKRPPRNRPSVELRKRPWLLRGRAFDGPDCGRPRRSQRWQSLRRRLPGIPVEQNRRARLQPPRRRRSPLTKCR